MLKVISSIFAGLILLMSTSTEAQNQFDASPKLGDLIFLALDHGVDSIRQGGPLVPFIMTDTDGKRSFNRFVAEPYEKAVAEAKAAATKLPPQSHLYALAYDGFITVGGKKYDAIIVHGAERGQGNAYLLAQRYVPASNGKPLESIGNPAFIGRENALFQNPP
jgi:hypothetical protein